MATGMLRTYLEGCFSGCVSILRWSVASYAGSVIYALGVLFGFHTLMGHQHMNQHSLHQSVAVNLVRKSRSNWAARFLRRKINYSRT